MQKILIIIHAAPYGSERCLSALRLATALTGRDDHPEVRLFLMSDATVLGLPNQVDTCALARGIADLPLIAGVTIGTLPELADATVEADKVITF